jgi:hypothetical protein
MRLPSLPLPTPRHGQVGEHMTGPDYESHEDAWQSGYLAALHDVEEYAKRDWPWWLPRSWMGFTLACVCTAMNKRGDDL